MHGGGGVSLSERRQEAALAPSVPKTFLTQPNQKTRDALTRTGHFDWQRGGANPVSPLSTSKWVLCLDICRLYQRLVPTEAPWDCDPKKPPQSPSVSGVSPISQLACNHSAPLCASPATAGVCPRSHWGKSSPVWTERPDSCNEVKLLNSGTTVGHLLCYQKYKNTPHKYPKAEPSKHGINSSGIPS